MTTKITDKNILSIANLFVSWQSVITADGSTTTTGVAGRGYFINTTSAAHTFILPTSATAGDTISIKDYAGTFASNKLTINRNGHNIQGVANNSLIGTNRAALTLVYIDVTRGWEYVKESNVANLVPTFISATGGTITTSGDYKIHTFTGDGCFAVSQLGNGPTVPTGGPQTVSYLVVAGGGAGGINSGGAGAGGFREGRDITPSYTASPLVAPTGLTVTTTTYPVTVGAGGTGFSAPGGVPCGGCGTGFAGSNSIFATITSAGGGGGGGGNKDPINPVVNGGSGGGGGNTGGPNIAGGSGNTPPVSPPQGNSGGSGKGGYGSGSGGGAGASGNSPPTSPPQAVGAIGGVGVSTSISGTSTSYAGGGGGGSYGAPGGSYPRSPCGTGGGSGNTAACKNGTANTGGGGGGLTPCNPGASGSGGKGVVIIRYKFQ